MDQTKLVVLFDGKYKEITVIKEPDGQLTFTDGVETFTGGPTLGCLLGLHAWYQGKCLNCGKAGP